MALVLLPCSVRRCYVFPSQHFSCLQFLPAVCRSRSWRLPVPVPIVMASFRLGCQFVIPLASIRLCFIKTLQQRPFQHKFQGSSGDEINNKYTKIKGVRCQQAQPVQIGRNGEGPAEVQESTRRQTGKRAARGTRQDSSRERPCKRSELGVRTNIREEKHE